MSIYNISTTPQIPPGRTGFGAKAFTGAQYIAPSLPTPPPFSVPGVTPPTAQEWASITGYQRPTASASGVATWNQYISDAYHGRLPSRLREVNAAIRGGGGLDDRTINQIMYEDAQWGGSMQDVPTSAIVESRGQYPGGNPMAYAGGPGSGNAERLLEDQLGTDIYRAPIRTAAATQYGPLTSVAQNLGRASDRGVPTAAIQQAADFDAGLQAARYDQGDLPTNTGPGRFFQLAALVPGLQPIAGIAEAIKNRDFATGLLALSSPIHGDLINLGKTLAGDAVSNLGFHKLGASIAPEISDLNAIIAQTPFGQTPEFAARVGLSPSPVAQSVRLARGNAVPGARTGINSALPEMGGGLTTAQGAGRAALNKIPRPGLTGAVLAANSPTALTTASMPFLDRATNTLEKVLNSQAAQNLSAAEMNAPATVFLQPPAITRGATAQSQYASPTTGLREALARNLAQRLAGNRLTALSPVDYGLLRV